MKILIDGRLVAKVARAGQATIQLAPGPHEVVAKMDWLRSEPVTVTIGGGEDVQLGTQLTMGRAIRLHQIEK